METLKFVRIGEYVINLAQIAYFSFYEKDEASYSYLDTLRVGFAAAASEYHMEICFHGDEAVAAKKTLEDAIAPFIVQ